MRAPARRLGWRLRHPVIRRAAVDRELEAHVRLFFSSHAIAVLHDDPDAPVHDVLPRFRVLEVAPREGLSRWTYVSLGAWEATRRQRRGIEFLTITRGQDRAQVRMLAMTAYYHANPEDPTYRLGLGHTVPIGEPIAPGSKLDHQLLSLPYPLDAEFAVCHPSGFHVDFLWLLPISESEKTFRHEVGLDELEQRLERARIDYTDPLRPPVA